MASPALRRRVQKLPLTPSTTPPLEQQILSQEDNLGKTDVARLKMQFPDDALMYTSPPASPSLTNEEKRKLNDPAVPRSFQDNRTLPQSLSEVNWVHFVLLLGTPLIAFVGIFILRVPLLWQTAVFSVFYYFFSGLGITAGYHRYWAHRSYEAHPIFQWLLVAMGSASVEGSIRWWSRGHRQHHRYTDTPKDPYSANLGVFWSHMGWMLTKEKPEHRGQVDITDLNRDPLVHIQHKYYPLFALFFGIIVPTAIPGLLWGDWKGGYIYSAVARLVFVHHATFCVNSLAHWLGSQTYDDRLSPRNHVITALVTLGEGYHNFHHEFPHDFRNGIKWYHYDPTKWLILFTNMIGLTWDLHKFPEMEIEKGVWEMKVKKLAEEKKRLDFGKDVTELPLWSWKEFKQQCKQHPYLIINNIVYDAQELLEEHPGGKTLIKLSIGKDVTYNFNGGVYYHSRGARNWMMQWRVARVEEILDDEE